MDESQETPTPAARPVAPDDCIARKFWQTRSVIKFGFLNANDNGVVTRNEVIKFSCRI